MSEGRIRIDKWLWHARFFKTRSLASQACRSGSIRVNGTHVRKASQALTPGDVMTFPRGGHVRVVRMLAPGSRRGPASEACTLYDDLAPPGEREQGTDAAPNPVADRPSGSGRPTKAERRATDRLRGR